MGDSRGKETNWFEFFTTNAGPLEKGYEYTVTLSYKAIRCEEKAKLYGLFRSKRKGWGQWDRGWTDLARLETSVGALNKAEMTVGLDTFDDYELMLGINGDARVAIDNIRITRGKPFREPTPEEKILKQIPDSAEVSTTLDFERAPDRAATHLSSYARVSASKADVIDGAGSLLVDTTRASGEWNEAFKITGRSFPKGYAYHVFLKHKGLDKGNGGYAYMLLRSLSRGHGDADLGWTQWGIDPGQTEIAYKRIEVTELDDYELIFGTYKGVKFALDDIVIRREPVAKRNIKERMPLVRTDANLVWSDEFDGASIDAKKWRVEGDVRRRRGYWMKEDAYLDGEGHLVVRFKRRPDGNVSGGSIGSLASFKRGYFEARIKLPRQEGHWPGFWLMAGGVSSVGNEGRDGTEIDIVEAPWRYQDAVTHTLHWDGYGPEHAQKGQQVTVPGINEGWHTFAVDWSVDGYIFFVDGNETWRSDAGGVSEIAENILLTDEEGGWSGDPNKAALPDYTYVYYVRVWQDTREVHEPTE